MPNLRADRTATRASPCRSAAAGLSVPPAKGSLSAPRTVFSKWSAALLAAGLAGGLLVAMPPIGQAVAISSPVSPHTAFGPRSPNTGEHQNSTLSFTVEHSGIVALRAGSGQWMHWNIVNVTAGRRPFGSPRRPTAAAAAAAGHVNSVDGSIRNDNIWRGTRFCLAPLSARSRSNSSGHNGIDGKFGPTRQWATTGPSPRPW